MGCRVCAGLAFVRSVFWRTDQDAWRMAHPPARRAAGVGVTCCEADVPSRNMHSGHTHTLPGRPVDPRHWNGIHVTGWDEHMSALAPLTRGLEQQVTTHWSLIVHIPGIGSLWWTMRIVRTWRLASRYVCRGQALPVSPVRQPAASCLSCGLVPIPLVPLTRAALGVGREATNGIRYFAGTLESGLRGQKAL